MSQLEVTYLITPGEYWTLGSNSRPSLSFDLEMLKTATDMAIERNNEVSATSLPGHILPGFKKQDQWMHTKLMVANTFSQSRTL